jgi:hypothetical protein
MVRYIKHTALFLSLAFIAGCNPGITDPEPSVIKNLGDYYWDSEANSSLRYEYFRVEDSSRKEFEYTFSRLNGFNSTTTVSEVPLASKNTFYYKFDTTGSILAGGLSYHTLFPLPDGYEIEPSFSKKEFDTVKYGTKKVIALNNNAVIVLRSDDSVFYSTNNGISWERSSYRQEFGVVTAWTRVQVSASDIIYGGTSNGSCVSSKDGGKTWKLNKTLTNTAITSIAATSTGIVYLSSGNKIVFSLDVNTNTFTKQTYTSAVTSLAACEVYNDSGKTYPVFMIGTIESGLFYWIEGKSTSINYAKGGSTKNIISIAPTGRSFAVALGYTDASKLSFLYSLNAGTTWETVDVPFTIGAFLDAVPSVSIASILVADELGNVYLGSSQQGTRPIFDSPSPSRIGFPVKDISINEKAIIAAVDTLGVMVSTDSGNTWSLASKGLWQTKVRERKTDGTLTLLPMLVNGLKKDDQWLAGYLASTSVGATAVVELNAKVVEHYSRLDLPFSAGSYSDVYEVSYTCAPNDRGTNTVHVFYAKEYGPILFQRYVGSDLVDESYLVKK